MLRFIANLLFGAILCASAAPSEAARVASLNPGLTELMVALDLAETLVAVSDYCTAPESNHLVKLGTELTPNTEALLASRPSHVLTGKSLSQQRVPLLSKTQHLSLPITTASEVRDAIMTLGQTFGREEKAAKVLKRLDAALHQAPKRYSRVLVVAGISQHQTSQLYLLNPKSLHGDLLEAAGFQLIPSPVRSRSWVIGPEKLLRLNPDLIIVLDPSARDGATKASYMTAFNPLQQVASRATGDVIYLTDPTLSSMGIGALGLRAAAIDALSSIKARANVD